MRGWLRGIGPTEVIILLGGALLIATAVYANTRAGAVTERTHAWGTQIHEVSRSVTLAHALASAPAATATAEVDSHLTRADESCATLLAGVRDPGGGVVVAFALPETGAAVAETCAGVEALGRLLRDRLDGAADEEAVATTLADVLAGTGRLPALIASEFEREQTVLDRILGARVAFIALVFAGMTWLVRRRRLLQEEATERHRFVLEAASDGIVGLDASGRIVFANPAAARLTGHGQSALVGAGFHELLHGDDAHASDACPVLAAEEDGTMHGRPDTLRRSDGTGLPVEISSATNEAESGQAVAALVFRDVSERRRVEQMRSEFVSVVSHELRTPLTSIHGALGLLRGGALGEMPERAERMIEIAHSSSQRLIRLINDILDIERLDGGERPLEERVTALAPLAERAAAALGTTAAERDVTIVTDLEPVSMRVDPDRIEQTIVNLLSNAVKYSPPAGTVRLATRVDDEGAVRVSVRDEGRGIPADHLDTIFGRFEQVDASDRRELGGTGLGLAISKSIVEHHGGHIWAESRIGEGSTFTFSLPASRLLGATAPQVTIGGPKVLVCDDDEHVLEVVAELLGSSGFEVVTSASGDEALELALSERPDVIVLDLLMPGTDGWAVASELRSRAETRAIPIVLLSVIADVGRGLELGEVSGRVAKPFQPADLLAALTAALRGTGDPTVLVVEDDVALGRVLVEAFRESRIRGVHVSSGEEAIAWCARNQPAAISLDVMLPGRSGFDVVGWLRRNERLRDVPIVVYSARDVEPTDRERLRLGPTEFFTKSQVPIDAFRDHVVALLAELTGAGRRP